MTIPVADLAAEMGGDARGALLWLDRLGATLTQTRDGRPAVAESAAAKALAAYREEIAENEARAEG
jgi:hypothetical protein